MKNVLQLQVIVGHIEKKHATEKLFKGGYHEECFATAGNCNIHEGEHTSEKLVKCRYCEKCSTIGSACKIHERTHTGKKPFKCL